LPFLDDALSGRPGRREHATVGWGSTPTVITREWWFNCKMDGTGVLLYDLQAAQPFARNVADGIRMWWTGSSDQSRRRGQLSKWLVKLACEQADAPGYTATLRRRVRSQPGSEEEC
jgi:hypothetical protein